MLIINNEITKTSLSTSLLIMLVLSLLFFDNSLFRIAYCVNISIGLLIYTSPPYHLWHSYKSLAFLALLALCLSYLSGVKQLVPYMDLLAYGICSTLPLLLSSRELFCKKGLDHDSLPYLDFCLAIFSALQTVYSIFSILKILSIKPLHILSLVLNAILLCIILNAKTLQRLKSLYMPNTKSDMLNISEQGIDSLYDRFLYYMRTRRPYLLENCQIELVAKELYTNKTYLSKMVNSHTGLNLPKLMNKYRVDYSIELFKNDPRLKVSELASMSGFNSTVTFNMAFKYFEKVSPSEWCRIYRNTSLYQFQASPLEEEDQD